MRLSTNELKTKYRFNIIKEEVQTSIGTLYLSKVKDYQRFFSVCGILFLERHELSSLLEKIDERLAKMYESRHIFDFLSYLRNNAQHPGFDTANLYSFSHTTNPTDRHCTRCLTLCIK